MSQTDLTNLLEEMIVSASPPGEVSPHPSLETEERVLPRFFHEKAHKRKLPLFPLILSLSFLGGLSCGILFGYYWAHSKLTPKLLETPTTYFQEVIEPIAPSNPSLALALNEEI